MAYQNNSTDWLSKEKRELFAKAVNSMIMNNVSLKEALDNAKKIVDTAFKHYPDKENGSGETLEEVIK